METRSVRTISLPTSQSAHNRDTGESNAGASHVCIPPPFCHLKLQLRGLWLSWIAKRSLQTQNFWLLPIRCVEHESTVRHAANARHAPSLSPFYTCDYRYRRNNNSHNKPQQIVKVWMKKNALLWR